MIPPQSSKIKNHLLIAAFFMLAMLSCSELKPTERPELNKEFLNKLHQQVAASELPDLLAGLSGGDSLMLDSYKSQLLLVSDRISKDWNIPAGKLIINSYIKGEMGYTHYQYKNNSLEVFNAVPEHIENAFNDRFVCYSPSYREQFPKEIRSAGFPFNGFEQKIRFEIIHLE